MPPREDKQKDDAKIAKGDDAPAEAGEGMASNASEMTPVSSPESSSQQREVVEATVQHMAKDTHAKIALLMSMPEAEVRKKLKSSKEAPAFREQIVDRILDTRAPIGQLLAPIKNPAKHRMVVMLGKKKVTMPAFTELVRNPNSPEALKLIHYFEHVANDANLRWIFDNLMDEGQKRALQTVMEIRKVHDSLLEQKDLHGIGARRAEAEAGQGKAQRELDALRNADAAKARALSSELPELRKERAEATKTLTDLQEKRSKLRSELQKIEGLVGALGVKKAVKFTDSDIDTFGPKTVPQKLSAIALAFGPKRKDTAATLGTWISDPARRRRGDLLLQHARYARPGKPLPADVLLADLVKEHLRDPQNRELTEAQLTEVGAEVRKRMEAGEMPSAASAESAGEAEGQAVSEGGEASPDKEQKPTPHSIISRTRRAISGTLGYVGDIVNPSILFQ
ncbi:hypothetical protein COU80_04255 [Candidatus Peregrinibacteria bacterium CG10_big_fil_rev_8_21_14_0_10_55_24]|nr:MAG: hypothetical protein COU80_04255 [Candidatus Peregrinibacteria bacterium CG10_big_fil_rev_8_21_14_0_10_55_24]